MLKKHLPGGPWRKQEGPSRAVTVLPPTQATSPLLLIGRMAGLCERRLHSGALKVKSNFISVLWPSFGFPQTRNGQDVLLCRDPLDPL